MERRVFSLSSIEERRFVIGYLVLFGILWGVPLWLDHHSHFRPGLHWARAITIGLLCAVCALRYWSNRVRTLEVTDDGLVMRSWLRKPLHIRWDMVTSVKKGYEMLSFSLGERFDSAVVRAVDGHRIAIPGTSPNSHEIIDILKQRLPESVFVAR